MQNKKNYTVCLISSVFIALFVIMPAGNVYADTATCGGKTYDTEQKSCCYDELIDNDKQCKRLLEQTYPKIPLPPFGNVSLNDIQAGIDNKNPLSLLILYFYTMSVMVVGLVAFGVIIMAGFQFLASGANPSLRNKAKSQLQAAGLGIVILLSSWLILNTINPELTLIKIPRTEWKNLNLSWPGVDSIDLETLQYGGVVIYEDDVEFGEGGKSEVVFGDIKNLHETTFVGNDQISAIWIGAGCTVRFFRDENFDNDGVNKAWIGPVLIDANTLKNEGLHSDPPTNLKHGISSIQFEKREEGCLGNSIRAYRDEDYVRDSKEFIYDDNDLSGDRLLPGATAGAKANDSIGSMKFAQGGSGEFSVSVCDHRDRGGLCVKTSGDEPDFRLATSTIPEELNNKISSIYLGGSGGERQAGVILYEHADFGGLSEIFIRGDKNLDVDGNIIQTIAIDSTVISSLRIIGKYKVTLYNLSFGGEWIEIDNTNGIPIFRWSASSSVPPNITFGEPTREFYKGSIIEISELSKFGLAGGSGGDWNDEVKSIKIELPTP